MSTEQLLTRLRKKLKRGALSRISEHCDVAPNTVRNWLSGTWIPGDHQLPKLRECLTGAIDLSARKTGPSRPRANGVQKKFASIANNS